MMSPSYLPLSSSSTICSPKEPGLALAPTTATERASSIACKAGRSASTGSLMAVQYDERRGSERLAPVAAAALRFAATGSRPLWQRLPVPGVQLRTAGVVVGQPDLAVRPGQRSRGIRRGSRVVAPPAHRAAREVRLRNGRLFDQNEPRLRP